MTSPQGFCPFFLYPSQDFALNLSPFRQSKPQEKSKQKGKHPSQRLKHKKREQVLASFSILLRHRSHHSSQSHRLSVAGYECERGVLSVLPGAHPKV